MNSKRICLVLVSAWFIGFGLAHILFSGIFVDMVPGYIEYPVIAVYISGFFHFAGALALLVRRLRYFAGLGLIVLTLAVTPSAIHMWMHPWLYPEVAPFWFSLRLVVHVLLIAALVWIIWPDPRQGRLRRPRREQSWP